jgi:magnesium transporter
MAMWVMNRVVRPESPASARAPATAARGDPPVEFGEVHVFAGPRFVITVRYSEAPDLSEVRHDMEARPDLLRRGPAAVLHAIMDPVVDYYVPVVAGVENDIDEIEDELFDAAADASRRIYELTREVINFQRAIKPLPGMLEQLMAGPGVDDEERRYLRDIQTTRCVSRSRPTASASCSETSSTST